MVTVTREFLESGKSLNGGWSREQLELIGVPWPPVSGWRREAIGRELGEEDAGRFIALRNAHLMSKAA